MEQQDYDVANSQLLWRLVWERRALVLTITIGFGILATVLAFVVTPRYRSQVVLIPTESSSPSAVMRSLGDLGSLASLAGFGLGGGRDQVVEAIALLQSRQLAVEFIRDEDLIPVLFQKRWDAERGTWNVAAEDVPTEGDAYDYFDKSVRRVTEDRRTGLVTLTIEWRDPEAAARWAMELVRRLNTLMRTRAIAEADASIEQLKDRLNAANVVALQQSVAGLLEAQIKQRTFATVRDDYAFRVVDPAVVPDLKDRAYPRRPLFLIVGTLAGFLFGVLGALTIGLIWARPR